MLRRRSPCCLDCFNKEARAGGRERAALTISGAAVRRAGRVGSGGERRYRASRVALEGVQERPDGAQPVRVQLYCRVAALVKQKRLRAGAERYCVPWLISSGRRARGRTLNSIDLAEPEIVITDNVRPKYRAVNCT